jgi:hypothetical protein
MAIEPGKLEEPKPVVVVDRRSNYLRGLTIVTVLAIVGIGVYRQWFTVATHDQRHDQKVDIKLTIDTAKIKEDTKMAAKKTEEEASKLSAKVKEEASKLRDQSK